MDLHAYVSQTSLGSFIGGEFVRSGETIEFASQIDGKLWKNLYMATQEQVSQAINDSQQAFHIWKNIPAPKRADYLRKIGQQMLEHRYILAEVMAKEMGKPVKEGVKEVEYAAGYFFWYAGEAERIYGTIIPSQYEHQKLILQYEPVGVCGIITPWNFPQAMAARKIAAALAAGCTIVCKPSPESPVSLLILAKMFQSIGFPKGVLNVLIGDEKMIGAAFLSSPMVRKISFTGSTDVGRYLYQNSAQTLKKLTLELGGHAPFLVFADANIDKAVEGVLSAKFRNNGQTCIAANRILVQRNVYQIFTDKLILAVKKLRVGDPLDPLTDISRILHPASIAKVRNHILDALKKGASSLLAGKDVYDPVILGDITKDMHVYREETFGPLLPLMIFDNTEEGIALANDSAYGLASYAFTQSLSIAQELMDKLEYGIIGINDGLPSTPQASFGGIKNSGFGREGGPTGIREYLHEKYVSLVY